MLQLQIYMAPFQELHLVFTKNNIYYIILIARPSLHRIESNLQPDRAFINAYSRT